MATSEVMLPLDFVMKEYRPWYTTSPSGVGSWSNYMNYLRSEGRLHSTAEDVMRRGFRAVTLSPYGVVTDGEMEVVAAYMKGVRQILCVFEFCDLP